MKREIKIGLTVIFALLLLYLVLAWVSGKRVYPGETTTYRIKFPMISGLLEGDPVLYRGYELGNVKQITPYPDHIEVVIQLQKEIPLYTDAYAEIQPKEIMGGKQVQLVQGVQAESMLEGNELTGTTAMDFSSGFSKMGKMIDQIETTRLEPLLTRVDSLLFHANQLLGSLDPSTLRTTSSLLNKNLQDLQIFLTEIRERKLISTIDSTLIHANQLTKEGAQTLGALQGMIARADTTLLPGLEQISDTLPIVISQASRLLNTSQDLLENEQGLVGKMIRDSTLFVKVDSTVILLNQVLRQIQKDKIIVGFKRRKDKDD